MTASHDDTGAVVDRPTPPYEWTFAFMRCLSELSAALSPDGALSRYIKPILDIKDDDTCLEPLDAFVEDSTARAELRRGVKAIGNDQPGAIPLALVGELPTQLRHPSVDDRQSEMPAGT